MAQHGVKGGHVPPLLQRPQVVAQAEDLARYLLSTEPERLAHSEAVAVRAQLLTPAVDAEQAPLLVAAAWLHDVGYPVALHQTSFHPVDGARYLQRTRWPADIYDLVAHHSGSRFVALARGLEQELAPFTFVEDPLTDALTVADQTAGPHGRPMSVHDRIEDMLRRHGPDSPNARVHPQRGLYLLAAAHRVAGRLTALGITPDQHRIFRQPGSSSSEPAQTRETTGPTSAAPPNTGGADGASEVVFRLQPKDLDQVVTALHASHHQFQVEQLNGATYIRVTGPEANVVALVQKLAPSARRILL